MIFLHMLNRDEKIVASIARIGFPVAPVVQKTSKKRKTVRAVALGVMFLQRARYVGLSHLPCIALIYFTASFYSRASEAWRNQCAQKPAVQAALEEVRRRRIENGTGGRASGSGRP